MGNAMTLRLAVLVLLAWGCGGTPKRNTTGPVVPEPAPEVETLPAPPAPKDGLACVGEILAPPDGLRAVTDPALLERAMDVTGNGKLCTGRVYEATKSVTVYRVWTKAKAYSELGSWWSFSEPLGPVDAYREANAICPEWSDLDILSRCTIKVGARVVVGPGQSASCTGDGVDSYPKSNVNQVYIPNDTRKDEVFVEGCTPGTPWPAP